MQVHGTTLALAWLLVAGPVAVQDATRSVEETYEDGTARLSYEVRGAAGSEVRHGSYKRFHPGLVLAVEGSYSDGEQSGEWKAWYPDGSPMLSGSFHEGRRSGRWEMHHPSGQIAAVGEYLLGCRDRRWVYFDAEGTKLEEESGLYRVDRGNHPDRSRAWVGETIDGVRHGAWHTWWPNGVPQTDGAFRHGVRQGALEFFLLDGTRETEFLSGVYVDGERRGDATVAPDPFRLPEEDEAAFRGSPEPDPTGLPRAARAPGVKGSERESMREWVRRYVELEPGEERRKAGMVLVQYGRAVVPEVLEALRALDLEDPGAREVGAALVAEVLRGIAKSIFPWSAGGEAEDLALDRLAVVRWLSWWELVREDDAYWKAVAASGEGAGPALFDLARMDPAPPAAEPQASEVAAASAPALDAPLFEARRRAAATDKHKRQLGLALDWLVRHQDPSGRWNAVGFEQRCEGDKPCLGAAHSDYDVGLTGLALLALLGRGDTPTQGEYADAIARGVAFLRTQQKQDSGCYVDTARIGFLYEHCLATEALCEVALVDPSPELRAELARAVQLIHDARNPRGAWRYAFPPDGNNDTSVTSWCVAALAAAQRAGFDVDPNAMAGARWWIDRATDPKTGRIGYDSRGSFSARVARVNDHYPADLTEALSAAGLHVARLLGERHFDEASLERTRGLLFARAPTWSESGLTNDLYYWFHGAQALQGRRDAPSRKWREALEEALGEGQRRDGEAAGSWDPNGPWGASGGRIYSTAIAALALSADTRHAEPAGSAARER